MKEKTISEKEFLAFLEKYKRLIIKVAYAYVKEAEDRKDLIQDITLQLWRAFPSYDGQAAYSTWTYRIALNVSISFLRKMGRRKRAREAFEHQQDLFQWENHELEGKLNKLHQAINMLKPLDKALVILQLEGIPHKEMAEIMGISPSNVSTKLNRIKNKLKKQLTNTTK